MLACHKSYYNYISTAFCSLTLMFGSVLHFQMILGCLSLHMATECDSKKEALGPVPPQSSSCSLEQIPRGKNSDSSALPTSRLQPRMQHFCVAATLFSSCSVVFYLHCLQSKKHLYYPLLAFTSKNQLSCCRGRRLGSTEKSETCRSKGQGSTCSSQTLVL